jgi:phospholipase B1
MFTSRFQACIAYMQAEYAIETSRIFDQRDDFTFVVQPFWQDVVKPPQKVDSDIVL